MKKIAILGAGRIGQVHARAVAGNENAVLAAISDPVAEAAQSIADRYGATVCSHDEIIADAHIDGVVICTPTDLHADQIEACSRAGKAVFCEKPIDLDVGRVKRCLDVMAETKGILMVGFNRRFDPHFKAVKAEIIAGRIGTPEMGIITSRDPGPPPDEYILRSGGIFRDMMIHDFDMAVFLMGSMPERIMAAGSVLTDPNFKNLGDFDSASSILYWEDGRQVMISNSRRATYGYDQRLEVHGSEGMVAAENDRPVRIEVASADGYRRPPLHDFFMTRYVDAYANEIAAFIAALSGEDVSIPGGRDGLNSLLIAEAALESATTGKAVDITP